MLKRDPNRTVQKCTHPLCSKSGIEQPIEEFYWRNKAKGVLHSWCKTCQTAFKILHKKISTHIIIAKANCTECGLRLAFGSSGLCRPCYDRQYHRSSIGKQVRAKRDRTPAGRHYKGVCMAKSRGYEWTISFEEFKILNSQFCYYCDGILPKAGHGLDRVDNNRGYTLNNVVPCCTMCNRMKSSLTMEEFLIHINKISSKKREKK